jgi:hypothetical protein
MPDSPSPRSGLITATIEAATGKVIDVRSIDEAGEAIELTTDRRAKLAKQSGGATLEDLFEQAFEAGIACVLGDEAEDESESEDDVVLQRQILRPMIENSAARDLMRRDVLGRAIVATLIEKTIAQGADAAAPSRSSPKS